MMTRRRLLLFGLPAALLLISVAIWLMIPAEARKIQPGMTLAEVEEILGGPADRMGKGSKGRYPRIWDRGGSEVTVYFDGFDRVGFVDHPESLLDRLRRRLGLP
jgi:hypothetical protein